MAAISSTTTAASTVSTSSNERAAENSEKAKVVTKKSGREPTAEKLEKTADLVSQAMDALGQVDAEVSQHLNSALAALSKNREMGPAFRLKKAREFAERAVDELGDADATAARCFQSALTSLNKSIEKVEKKPVVIDTGRAPVEKSEKSEKLKALEITSRLEEEELRKEAISFQETAFIKKLLNGNKCYVCECVIGTKKFSVLFKNDSPTQISHEIFTDSCALEKSRSQYTDCTYNSSEASEELAALILKTSRNNFNLKQPSELLQPVGEYLKYDYDTDYKLLFPKVYALHHAAFDPSKNTLEYVQFALDNNLELTSKIENKYFATLSERDGLVNSIHYKDLINYDNYKDEITYFMVTAADEQYRGKCCVSTFSKSSTHFYVGIIRFSSNKDYKLIRVFIHMEQLIDWKSSLKFFVLPKKNKDSTSKNPPPQSSKPAPKLLPGEPLPSNAFTSSQKPSAGFSLPPIAAITSPQPKQGQAPQAKGNSKAWFKV